MLFFNIITVVNLRFDSSAFTFIPCNFIKIPYNRNESNYFQIHIDLRSMGLLATSNSVVYRPNANVPCDYTLDRFAQKVVEKTILL